MRAKVRSLPRIEVTQVRGVQVISYIRAFLNARRFVEVETPTLWPTVGMTERSTGLLQRDHGAEDFTIILDF